MQRMVIEIDMQLYTQLLRAAGEHDLTLEAECLRRLQGAEGHSRYLDALLANLRAEEQQRRASAGDQPV